MLRAIVVTTVLASALCLANQADADQKSDDVQTLLRVTGRSTATIAALVDARVHLVLQRFINAHPDLTGAEVVTLETQVIGVENQFLGAVNADRASYYYTALSDGQIRAAIAFFESPEGEAYKAATAGLAQATAIDMRQRLPVLVRSVEDLLEAAVRGHGAAAPQPGPG